jgi:hypothetical protein
MSRDWSEPRVWLRGFHRWSSHPVQARLREEITKTPEMQRLKYDLRYSKLLVAVDNFLNTPTDAREFC